MCDVCELEGEEGEDILYIEKSVSNTQTYTVLN
jgi:hypothetical protein